jgi:hypothetical protein
MLRDTTALAALLVTGALAGSVGCSSPPSSPTPTPTPPPPPVQEVAGATRGASEGETSVWLVAADPAPGSLVAGCRAGASGCGGRIRMTLRVLSPAGGPSLGLLALLHSDRATACFRAISPALTLPVGTPRDVEVAFDPMDTDEACPTPLEVTHLAVVVEGTSAVFARQEWALRYSLVR